MVSAAKRGHGLLTVSAEDWKNAFGHLEHQEALSKMIKSIWHQRAISRRTSRGTDPWMLPMFDRIGCSDGEGGAAQLQPQPHSGICYLYRREYEEEAWNCIRKVAQSRVWWVEKVPFTPSEAEKLLGGRQLNDEIINGYLIMCAYLNPSIKFLATFWFSKLHGWGTAAAQHTSKWVSSFCLLPRKKR